MSDLENAYQAPSSTGTLQSGTDASSGVTAATRDFIGQAAPWIKFLAVLGFIYSGLIVIIGIVMMFAGAMPGPFGAMGFAGPIIGLLYIGIALVLFFPCLFAMRMGSASTSYKLGGTPASLETVALNLRKYVKFLGILAIVGLSMIPVGIVVVIIATISRGMAY